MSDTEPPNTIESREVALRRLMRVEADAAFVARLGADAELPPREARAAADYVAGVTRLKRRLDFYIDHFITGDPKRLQPEVRQVLRVAFYDLTERRTPPHAAVSEAVALARQIANPGAAKLVNAVLRAATRGSLPEPDTGNTANDLATRHSYPTWIAKRLIAQFGTENAEQLLEAGNQRPIFGVRLADPGEENLQVLRDLGVRFEPSPWLPDYIRAENLQPLLREGWFDDARAQVQDEAAAFVPLIVDPQPGEIVRDICAAPGTKSIRLATLGGGQARIIASDIHESRTELVREAVRRAGLNNVEVIAADARDLARSGARDSDAVLLDAPCSGLGVMAKRADLRWNLSPEKITELVALQDELLDAAAGLVKPGGRLVYATCTLTPEENVDRVEAFLARSPAFQRDPLPASIPAALVTERGDYLAVPHIHKTDGAYAARLRRTS